MQSSVHPTSLCLPPCSHQRIPWCSGHVGGVDTYGAHNQLYRAGRMRVFPVLARIQAAGLGCAEAGGCFKGCGMKAGGQSKGFAERIKGVGFKAGKVSVKAGRGSAGLWQA
eukprot:1146466-Pelagomonas_calceolata.AAC.7